MAEGRGGGAPGGLAARLFVVAVFVGCALRLLAFVHAHAVDLIVYDQFDFLAPLFDGEPGWLGRLRYQFWKSPHRMGAGWPLIEGVARASGFSTRADAFAIAGVSIAAAAVSLLLARRLFGRLSAWDACLPLLVLGLKPWTTYVGTPDVALGALPVLLLLGLACVLTLERTAWRVAGLLVLDVVCIYTGFALFAGLLVPLLIAHEGWRGTLRPAACAAALGVALAAGLSFFVGYDFVPATRPLARDVGVAAHLAYATNLFRAFASARGPLAGALVGLVWPLALGLPLAGAAARLVRRAPHEDDALARVVLLLVGFSALFVVFNTLGRVGEGAAFGFTPRYQTLLVPGAIGLYLAARGWLRGRVRTLALAALALVFAGSEAMAARAVDAEAAALAATRESWKSCYLATHDFAGCNAAFGRVVYPHESEFGRIEQRLAWLEARGLNLYRDAAGAPPRLPTNVLLISVDTLRADHLGAYGHARDTSPHIDALARRGVLFEQAISTAPWTLPAHASLLTGLLPAQHGLQDDGVRLAASVPTLAGRLRERGFHTLGVVSHVYVASPFGLDSGFDVFDDSLIEGGTTNPRADAVVDRLLQHLDARPQGRPFFAFAHFFDPHWDYAAPPPWDVRFVDPDYDGPVDGSHAQMAPYASALRSMPPRDLEALVARYDGEIAWLDAQLGRLFDALQQRGLLDRTLVVLTADHGEEFEEHGRLGHGRTLFEEQLHVPLVFAGDPRLGAGIRRSAPVSLVDVAPTLLELFGAAPIEAAPGRSLLARPAPVAAAQRVLLAESIRFGIDLRAARSARHKLIEVRNTGWRLFFDLLRDPRERRPLEADPSGGQLAAALERYAAQADAGWQLHFDAGVEPLRLRATLRTPGRILAPRHYFSGRVEGSEARFERFALSPDGHALEIDARVRQHTGRVRFDTDPPDAPLQIEVKTLEGGALRFANGERAAPAAGPVALRVARDDPRVRAPLPRHDAIAPGVYLQARPSPPSGGAASLPAAARRHLEALGYVDAPAPERGAERAAPRPPAARGSPPERAGRSGR